MSESGRLTPERLAEIRMLTEEDLPGGDFGVFESLLAHIATQEGEIGTLQWMVKNLRQALIEHHAVAFCLSPNHHTALNASGGYA